MEHVRDKTHQASETVYPTKIEALLQITAHLLSLSKQYDKRSKYDGMIGNDIGT